MKPYTEIIKSTLFTFAAGVLLILWGYYNDGIVSIILGVLIIGVFTKNTIDTSRDFQELKLWQTQNNGTLIFFYPTKKHLQVEIENKIWPLLPKATLSGGGPLTRLAGNHQFIPAGPGCNAWSLFRNFSVPISHLPFFQKSRFLSQF